MKNIYGFLMGVLLSGMLLANEKAEIQTNTPFYIWGHSLLVTVGETTYYPTPYPDKGQSLYYFNGVDPEIRDKAINRYRNRVALGTMTDVLSINVAAFSGIGLIGILPKGDFDLLPILLGGFGLSYLIHLSATLFYESGITEIRENIIFPYNSNLSLLNKKCKLSPTFAFSGKSQASIGLSIGY
jgi:hypothetical protein